MYFTPLSAAANAGNVTDTPIKTVRDPETVWIWFGFEKLDIKLSSACAG